jgi:hypothetical protein
MTHVAAALNSLSAQSGFLFSGFGGMFQTDVAKCQRSLSHHQTMMSGFTSVTDEFGRIVMSYLQANGETCSSLLSRAAIFSRSGYDNASTTLRSAG